MSILIYILTGILSGLVTGITGSNSMSVILSILLLTGIPVHNAIGLCLTVQVFTMLITLISLLREVKLTWLLIVIMCIPAIITSYAGARVALQTPSLILEMIVIIALFLMGSLLLRAKPLKSDTDQSANKSQLNLRDLSHLGFAGSLSGFVAGLVGGGGNIMVTNALNRILGIAFRRAIALSLCLGIVAAAIGTIPYLQAGRVDLWAAFWIIIPALMVAWLSSHWSRHIQANRVRKIQGVYLIGVATLLVFGLLWSH